MHHHNTRLAQNSVSDWIDERRPTNTNTNTSTNSSNPNRDTLINTASWPYNRQAHSSVTSFNSAHSSAFTTPLSVITNTHSHTIHGYDYRSGQRQVDDRVVPSRSAASILASVAVAETVGNSPGGYGGTVQRGVAQTHSPATLASVPQVHTYISSSRQTINQESPYRPLSDSADVRSPRQRVQPIDTGAIDLQLLSQSTPPDYGSAQNFNDYYTDFKSSENYRHNTSVRREEPQQFNTDQQYLDYLQSDPSALSPVSIDTSSFDRLLDDFNDMLEGRTSTEWRDAFKDKRQKFAAVSGSNNNSQSAAALYLSGLSSPVSTSVASTPDARNQNTRFDYTNRRNLTPSRGAATPPLTAKSPTVFSPQHSPNTSILVMSDYDSPSAYDSRSPLPHSQRHHRHAPNGHPAGHRLMNGTRSPSIESIGQSGGGLARSGSLSEFWKEALSNPKQSVALAQEQPHAIRETSRTSQPPMSPGAQRSSQNHTPLGWHHQKPSRSPSPMMFNYSASTLPSFGTDYSTLLKGSTDHSTKQPSRPVNSMTISRGSSHYVQHKPNFSELNALIDQVAQKSKSPIHQQQQEEIEIFDNVQFEQQIPDSQQDANLRLNISVASSKPLPGAVKQHSPTQSVMSPTKTVSFNTGAQTLKPNAVPLSQNRVRTGGAQPNFGDLDQAVSLAMQYGNEAAQHQQSANGQNSTRNQSHKPEMLVLNKVSDILRQTADTLQTNQQLKPLSTSMSEENLPLHPTGLPSPRPKHHLREQMALAGLEPRSPTKRAAGAWSFASTKTGNSNLGLGTGSVMARVLELEKRPIVPLISPMPVEDVQLKSMHEETVYRTKPTIHVNLSVASQPKAAASSSGLATSILPQQQSHGASSLLSTPDHTNTNVMGGNSRVQSQVLEESPSMSALTRELENLNTQAANTTTATLGRRHVTSSTSTVKDTNTLPATLPSLTPNNKRMLERAGAAVPQFYFANGRPLDASAMQVALGRVKQVFTQLKAAKIDLENMSQIVKACNQPLYCKYAVMSACTNEPCTSTSTLTYAQFEKYWKSMCGVAHSEAAQFVFTLTKGKRKYLLREDLEILLQDVVDNFPGLGFLRDAPEFHSRYMQTVISRMFFCVNRSWSGRMSVGEVAKSNLLATLRVLEQVDDINSVTDYFSYEHFYVIYCKFWELDRDHDLFIDKHDLARHANNSISTRVVDRIFSGCVHRATTKATERMAYADFVYFLMAEEDKNHPTSIEYWFRVLDQDGDGVLSLYELELFYNDIKHKMERLGIEPMKFTDVLCQMLDMVNPRDRHQVRLGDLKKVQMASYFFNAFVNVHKYYEQEVTEGSERAALEGADGTQISAWDRYCAEEYELLMENERNELDEDGDVDEHTEINCDDSDDEENVPVVSVTQQLSANNNNNTNINNNNNNNLKIVNNQTSNEFPKSSGGTGTLLLNSI